MSILVFCYFHTLKDDSFQMLYLQFYFPCKTTTKFNHFIIKSKDKVKIGHPIYLLRESQNKNVESDLSHILSELCGDIDFLIVNHLQSGPGFISIATGPEILSYGT